MDLKSTYNKIAEDWFKKYHRDRWWVKGVDRFISFLDSGASVLDVGCGAGTKSRYLIKKGLKVIGIDFSEKMIKIARRGIPRGDFLVMDMKDINKLKGKFDGIFMQAILLHVPKIEVKNVLRVILNKLKSGGYLYIAVKEIKDGGNEEKTEIENKFGYICKRFYSYFNLNEIKKYLSGLNMEICYEDVIQYRDIRWICVIGKKK